VDTYQTLYNKAYEVELVDALNAIREAEADRKAGRLIPLTNIDDLFKD
jgi:hypothetical protein